MLHTSRQGLVTQARAARDDRGGPRRAPGNKPAPSARRRLPESGYFADVNPNSEVYSPLNFVETPDIRKRSGRYQSDFIWNTDWQSKMDREASEEAQRKRAAEAPPPLQSGGLGLARLHDLNNMEIDLSAQLKRRQEDSRSASKATTSSQPAREVKPFQAESRRWDRSSRYGSRAVISTQESEEEVAEAAAKERQEYERLKLDLQIWTLTLSALGFSVAWLTYSKEVAISYAVGAAGSVVYQRMLNRSVDSMVGGGLGGALGQPRLLIPLVLTLGYNRWNELKAEETGVMLQLLPMLLGFFTFKAALVSKQAATLLSDMADSAKSEASKA